MSFTATATLYIRVTQILKLRVETASPYEGHTSCTFFVRLLDPASRLLRHTSGLPKILPRLRLTLLTMLGLWGVPYEQPRQGDAPRSTPTYYLGGRMYVRCWFTIPRRGVKHFYQCLRLCSCGDRIPSTTPGAEPPRGTKDSGSARSHSTHLETSSQKRP